MINVDMRVGYSGHVPYHWYTASCTRCGWDTDSRNNPTWADDAAAHACGLPAPTQGHTVTGSYYDPNPNPLAKRALVHKAIRVTNNHGRSSAAEDDYIATCSVCGWQTTGNDRRDLSEAGTAHGDANHPHFGRNPKLGEPVHYRSYGTPGGEYKPECRAAIITAVGPSGRDTPATINPVSLAVFNPDGMFLKNDIPHDETHPSGGTWHWPCQ